MVTPPQDSEVTSSAATGFDLGLPYLAQGQLSEFRATGEIASVMAKVYSAHGENLLHCHPDEEHCFVVLEGQATFHFDGDTPARTVGPFQGVFLPRGAFYRFESSSDDNLVLIRFGAQWPGTTPSACYPDGAEKTASTEPIARVEPVLRPGPGFAGFPVANH